VHAYARESYASLSDVEMVLEAEDLEPVPDDELTTGDVRLVDSFLQEVRVMARLDERPVLPPAPRPPPMRDVFSIERLAAFTPPAIGGAEEGRAVPLESGVVPVVRLPEAQATVFIRRAPPTRSELLQWVPVGVCGFIAVAATLAAFFSSPLAHRPGVQSATRGVSALFHG